MKQHSTLKADDFYDKKVSIHVHIYDYDSIIALVEEVIVEGIFSQYSMEYNPFTKEFFISFKKIDFKILSL